MSWVSMKGRFLFDQIDFVCKRNSSVLFSITLYMLLGVSRAWAARVEAKGVSFGHVSSAIAAAKDGDTVVVPSGTATWTTPLNIASNIYRARRWSGIDFISMGVARHLVQEPLKAGAVSHTSP